MRRVRASHRPARPRRPSRSGAPRARRGRAHRLAGARGPGDRLHRRGRGDGRTLPGPAADDPDPSGDRPGRGAPVGGHRGLEGADARSAAGGRRDDSRRPRHPAALGRLRRRGGGEPRLREKEPHDAEIRVQGVRGAVRTPRPPRVLRARGASRVRLDHGERSLPAVRHTGGHAPYSFAWLGARASAPRRRRSAPASSPRRSATTPPSSRRRWAPSARCIRAG